MLSYIFRVFRIRRNGGAGEKSASKMQTILDTNPCQGISNPCGKHNFGFEILLSRINLSLRDHGDLFSDGRTMALKTCKRCKPRRAAKARGLNHYRIYCIT